MKPDEKNAETVKPLTVREAIEQEKAARRRQGHNISPPRDTGHSHGVGV
jgi:hypothetical protein